MTTASGRYTIFNRTGHLHEALLASVSCEVGDDGPWHYEPTAYDGGYGYQHTAGFAGLTPARRERLYAPFSPGFATANDALLDAERYEDQQRRKIPAFCP